MGAIPQLKVSSDRLEKPQPLIYKVMKKIDNFHCQKENTFGPGYDKKYPMAI